MELLSLDRERGGVSSLPFLDVRTQWGSKAGLFKGKLNGRLLSIS